MTSWIWIGMVLILMGFGVLIAGSIYSAYMLSRSQTWSQEQARPSIRAGGIVMLGPFPIAWGTDVPMLVYVLMIGLILLGILLVLLPVLRLI